jgi:hypothetical protein
MAIPRINGSFPFLECCLLVCGLVVYGPRPAFAQTIDSSDEPAQEAQALSETSRSLRSLDRSQENQGQPIALEAGGNAGCSLRGFARDTWTETSQFGHGLKAIPRGAVRPGNLKWELPILAATGLLIAKVDRPADNRIQSKSMQQTAGRWSNVGLGLEIGSAALAYGIGCGSHHSYLRETGFRALAAMGLAGATDLGLQFAFDRQYPYNSGGAGKFWGGGRSFPSGHAATSFAFAAVIAHRYPTNKWIKWGAYALATGVSLSRYPSKKHFPSDILIGATLGYVTGTYLSGH